MIRFVRYRADSAVSYGILEEAAVREIRGDPFHYSETGAVRPLSEVKLLCPCQPSKILAVGGNYRSHMDGRPLFAHPEIFFMPPSALQNPGDPIRIPRDAIDVHYEGELVVIIGPAASHVSVASAWDHVAGLAVGQDISERILQMASDPPQFSLGKSFPGFGPVGPWLVTLDEFDDPGDLELGCLINGEQMQQGRTRDMIFTVPELIEQLSAIAPLLPGDLIFTGTPSGVGMGRKPPRWLAPGDILSSYVEGIGEMRHRFAAPRGT